MSTTAARTEQLRDFMPSARVVADSVSTAGHRLTTIEVNLHRWVLAEFNTHRAFSRNSASSRAIPVHAVMRRIADQPAFPLRWPAEGKGMTGGDQIDPGKVLLARRVWLKALDNAVSAAEDLAVLGVHKSVVNRLLEPYMHTTVIVTGTDWDGFWAQRCSPLAQPEIRAAAEAMKAAYDASTPRQVSHGNWHLPYLTEDDGLLPDEVARYVSAARCARVSYLTHAGRRDFLADLDLYERLVAADPPHASPLEHVATPAGLIDPQLGNLTGWRQLRHLVLGG